MSIGEANFVVLILTGEAYALVACKTGMRMSRYFVNYNRVSPTRFSATNDGNQDEIDII